MAARPHRRPAPPGRRRAQDEGLRGGRAGRAWAGAARLSAAAPLVWITRAEPGAGATAARLRELGYTPLVAPLIHTRPLPGAAPDLTGVGSLAFTSRAGAEAFAARCLGRGRDLPVFAVGDVTAEAARHAGFTQVRSASGAGRDLLALILRAAPPGVVLHPGARDLAFDLARALAAAGREARALALYETVPTERLAPSAAEALQQTEAAAVLIHSPAAAETLAGLARADPLLPKRLAPLRLVALSAECARPLAALTFASRIVAATPDESSLLEALLGAGLPQG